MIIWLTRITEYSLDSNDLIGIDDDKLHLLPDIQNLLKHFNGGILGSLENFMSYDGENHLNKDFSSIIYMDTIFQNNDPDKPNLSAIKCMSKDLFLYLISLWKDNSQCFVDKIEKKLKQNENLKNNKKLIEFYNEKQKRLEDLNKIKNNLNYYYDCAMIKDIIE